MPCRCLILPCPKAGQQSRTTTGPLRRAHLKTPRAVRPSCWAVRSCWSVEQRAYPMRSAAMAHLLCEGRPPRRGGSGSGRSRYRYDTPITWLRKAIDGRPIRVSKCAANGAKNTGSSSNASTRPNSTGKHHSAALDVNGQCETTTLGRTSIAAGVKGAALWAHISWGSLIGDDPPVVGAKCPHED